MIKIDFFEYSQSNLVANVNYFFNKSINYVLDYSERDKEILDNRFFGRILMLTDQAKYMVFEENYIDPTWKEMISQHYVNTSYRFSSKGLRIHFFKEAQVESNNYLGYITLRIINEPCIILSSVMPNWDVLDFKTYIQKHVPSGSTYCEHDLHIMKAKKEVHMFGEELVIRTFPFLTQDSVVIWCAQAAILMSSLYLNKKYRYKKLSIRDTIHKYNIKQYPNRGLRNYEIEEIFIKNDIPCLVVVSNNAKLDEIERLVIAYLNSNMPCLITTKGHIMTVIGYIEKDGNRELIIYDDSSHFTSTYYEGSSCLGNFVANIRLDRLMELLRDEEDETLTVFIHENEKTYINFSKYYDHLSLFFTIDDNRCKHFLIESYKLKKYLKKKLEDNLLANDSKSQVQGFISEDNGKLPIFVWCTEVYHDEKVREMIVADSTKHPDAPNVLIGHFWMLEEDDCSIMPILDGVASSCILY